MTTQFNKKDLVLFGKYLLSEERAEKIKGINSSVPLQDKIKEVYDADIENFLESIKEID